MSESATAEHCILLADDEAVLLQTCAQLLNLLGYDVVTAENGLRALDLFQESPERFSLVMVDEDMPQLTGREVCQRIREAFPDQKLLICSGYQNVQGCDFPNLNKPYSLGDLESTLNELLS